MRLLGRHETLKENKIQPKAMINEENRGDWNDEWRRNEEIWGKKKQENSGNFYKENDRDENREEQMESKLYGALGT